MNVTVNIWENTPDAMQFSFLIDGTIVFRGVGLIMLLGFFVFGVWVCVTSDNDCCEY